MTSTAMLAQSDPPTTAAVQTPTLFISGSPYPAASCQRLSAVGVLDEREAIVSIDRHHDPLSATGAEQALSLLGAGAELRWLVRVGDAGQHAERFLSGRLVELQTKLSGESGRVRYLLRDRWSLILDEIVRSSWWAGSEGIAVEKHVPATARLEPRGNRSHGRYLVNGRGTCVFQEDGDPWRFFDLLVYLNVTLNLNLDQILLPRDGLMKQLPAEFPIRGTIRSILTRLFEMSGFQLDRRHGEETGRRHQRLRPINKGRPITLTLANRAEARSLVEGFEAILQREQEATLLGPGDVPHLDGAFILQPGWDQSLEGLPTATYDREHDDFLDYAEVFRRWRLPMSDPQLASLLESGVAPRESPRFRPRRDGGRSDPSTGVLVEYSFDGGTNWRDYTGELTLSPRRAELYLEAPLLPVGFAAAGNAGSLQLRLSASLRRGDLAPSRRILGNIFLVDQDAGTEQTQFDPHDEGGAQLADDDYDDVTLPPKDDFAEPKIDDDDDDDDDIGDVHHDPNSFFVGQPRRLGGIGMIEVALGPVDPGVQVGDLVTKVRGGLSPSAYVQRVSPLSVERIVHDLTAAQQTRLRLAPLREVR